MNYEETIQYLYDTAPMFQQVGSVAYKEGLENTFAIDYRLQHPHKNYRTLHIAGTNGKGSTSHLIASILQHTGLKVGLYTSPHLLDFRERIKVNGQVVSEQFVIEFTENNKTFFEEIHTSFFELTTAMAFSYFAREEVDVAVIETGLGGRLDCTNIIRPDLCVITNISFDHMAQLGNTLEAIAREKAGIIKAGIPVVIGEVIPETRTVFLEKARIEQAKIVFAEQEQPIIGSVLLLSGKWKFESKDYGTIEGELGGFAQEKNAATVLCAVNELKKLGYLIPADSVKYGFEHVVEDTGLLGRWQIVGNHPKIVLDTGHNTGGMQYIVRQLQSESCENLHLVIGMVNDKDISTVMEMLPRNAIYYFTQASVARALEAGLLAGKARMAGLEGEHYPTVEKAFEAATRAAGKNDLVFVGGSTFVVADALKIIQKNKYGTN